MIEVLAVEFSNTVTLGSTLVLVFGMAIALIFTIRANVVSVWKSNYEAKDVEVQRLAKEVAEEREKKHAALSEVAGLRLTRDLTPILEAQTRMLETLTALQDTSTTRYEGAMTKIEALFERHEKRAVERHAQVLQLGETIASKIQKGEQDAEQTR